MHWDKSVFLLQKMTDGQIKTLQYRLQPTEGSSGPHLPLSVLLSKYQHVLFLIILHKNWMNP